MRWSLKRVLLFDLGMVVIAAAVAVPVEVFRESLQYMSAMFSVAFVFHACLLFFKPLDFVIYDESPDSMLKYYWFFSIFAAAFLGGFVTDLVFSGLPA